MPLLKIIARRWIITVAIALGSLSLSAQKQGAREYQIKAVFLFNFAQFVEWPVESFKESNNIIIGVLGNDPFGNYLEETVRGEQVNGHPLVVHRFKQIEDVKACHILFMNVPDNLVKSTVANLKSRSILTVSDAAGFTQHGGMIRFFTEDNKTRIRINLTAAKSADLTISSKLLRLAEIVNPQNN